MLRSLTTLTAAALLVGSGMVSTSAPAQAAEDLTAFDASGSILLAGGGYGHGRGMSQYGAQGAALAGLTTSQILSFYYPGTTQAPTSRPTIRVKLDGAPSNGVVRVTGGNLFAYDRTNPGSPWALIGPNSNQDNTYFQAAMVGGVSTLQTLDSAGRVTWSMPMNNIEFKQANAATPVSVAFSGRTVAYRGTVQANPDGAGGFVPVDVLSMEDYLKGVVPSEMPSSWRPAAIGAQAVAARTYATAYTASAGWDICSTTTCQVYGGIPAEATASSAAIAATAGVVLTAGGAPIFAEFSSSDGGQTSAGTAGRSYIVSKPDPYDGWSGNSVFRWETKVSAATVQAAYPQVGAPTGLQVLAREAGGGPFGGRVTSLRIVGTSGSLTVTGDDFRGRTGIRSTLFVVVGASSGIVAKWNALGGAAGIGHFASGEYQLGAMRAEDFDSGSIYWTPAARAWSVVGAINGEYRATGADSRWGYPVADERALGPGRASDFTSSMITWTPSTGAHGILGAIFGTWLGTGDINNLGFPTNDEHAADGSREQDFQGGAIFWDASRGSIPVTHGIGAGFLGLGGSGRIGVAQDLEHTVAGLQVQTFSTGHLWWSAPTFTHWTHGAIDWTYVTQGYVGVLGAPTSEEIPVSGGVVQHFQNGSLRWDAATNTVIRV